MNVDITKPIPTVGVPSINAFEIKDIDEPLVSVKKSGLFVDSQYYKEGIAGAYKDCYVRETVLEKLLQAESILPKGLHLKIYDGYRPICIQQRLWNYYRQKLKNENLGLTDKDLDFKTSFFVSKPSYDIMQPSLHNTGGAVDLTLVDENKQELNMGTKFDAFIDKAWTNHYELFEDLDNVVRENRRILYNVMLEVGFTNLPSEWWHYDYGTKFWGYFKGEIALYKGIIDADFPNRIPLF